MVVGDVIVVRTQDREAAFYVNDYGFIAFENIETEDIVYKTKEYRLLMLIMLVWFTIAVMLVLIRAIKSLRITLPLAASRIQRMESARRRTGRTSTGT